MALWTPQEFEAAKALREQGFSCEDIGIRLNRTRGSVAKRLQGLWEGPKPDEWTAGQLAYLKRHLRASAALLMRPLSELGPSRSLSAIRSKKREFSDKYDPRQVVGLSSTKGWPVLAGSHEERDAQFAIRVIEAKHFSGLILDRKLVELMIDDVKRGLLRRKEAA